MHLSVNHSVLLFLVTMAAAFAGCSLVDEDMRECGTDHQLEYELRLVTNMTTEINTELKTSLGTSLELNAAEALTDYLNTIFTDFAHDLDLSFYDVAEDSLRLHHEKHIMDANQSSYTLYIPVRRYMHTALANLEENDVVQVTDDERCHRARLQQQVADTLPPHRTGLFTARLPMDIRENENQTFNVRLYMANSAIAVVVDTVGSHVRDIRMVATGFATGFNICDSSYVFAHNPVERMDELNLKDIGGVCFAGVNFPSKGPEGTKAEDSEGAWRIRAYARVPDGTVTETALAVHEQLLPGQLKILKLKAQENGAMFSSDPTVGVSITMDWNVGMHHDIDL